MPTSPNLASAALVRRARRHNGDSQKEFARRLGKSQAVISRYEAGKVDPPGGVVMQCMHILEVAPATSQAPTDERWQEVTEALAALTHAVRGLRPPSTRRSKRYGTPP
jgi:transcriptional regulator with XRE-family HTH domain